MQRYITGLLVCAFSVAASAQQAYPIGAQDVIGVTVWEQPDLSRNYVIAADGSFTFPLIGRVTAAGLSTAQLETELKSKLEGRFLHNPQVMVTLVEYRSQQVYIMGEVRQPGPITLSGNLTLIEALARAGSLTESAGGNLTVIRGSDTSGQGGPALPGQPGANEVLKIPVNEIRSGTFSQNLRLQDNDTIFVPRAELIYVIGQVNKPGAYTLEANMTVLRALSYAGGLTRLGSNNRIIIMRTVDGKESTIKAKLTDTVKAGDTIDVPTRRF